MLRRASHALLWMLALLLIGAASVSTAMAATDVDVFGLPQVSPSSSSSPASSATGVSSSATSSLQASPPSHSTAAASADGTDDGDANARPMLRLPEPLRVVLSAGIVLQGKLNARIEDAARQLRMGSSPALWWTLVLMSFIYGVLHAVGPGHGKLMVGAYLGSRNARVIQAIGLSIWTATVQALAAIVLVFAAFWFSRDGLIHVLSRAASLEVIGYGLLCAAGVWTLWSTVTRRDCCVDPGAIRFLPNRRRSRFFASRQKEASAAWPDEDRPLDGDYLGTRLATRAQRGTSRWWERWGGNGVTNGKSDAPRRRFSAAASAASSVPQLMAVGLAAGIRPCVGAIFVLVASVTAGIPGVGIASTFAMSAGVAITVTAIAVGGVAMNRVLVGRGLRYRVQVQRAQRTCAMVGAIVILLYGATQIALLLTGYLTPSIT